MSAVAMETKPRNRVHPYKYLLWIAMASMFMFFAAFTSAYIVRQAQGNWLDFQLPRIFLFSTTAIVLSSLSLHLSYLAFKKANAKGYKLLMVLSFLLGLVFLVLQYQGWQDMTARGISFTGNVAGTFVYVISGVHAAHLLGGLAALGVALAHAFILPFKPTEGRQLRFELTLQYWHFVDALWLYLLLFFILQR